MERQPPLVLSASVSLGDQELLAKTLESAGFAVRSVDDAEAAGREISTHGGACVLVIDSGLLEMTHDAQWRRLRARHPELGTVVHSLVQSDGGAPASRTSRTVLVHPDHSETLLKAVQNLTETAPTA